MVTCSNLNEHDNLTNYHECNVVRGIYLPLTDTPKIGNYNNPSQVVSGLYYQEGCRMITDKLVQKFTVINV